MGLSECMKEIIWQTEKLEIVSMKGNVKWRKYTGHTVQTIYKGPSTQGTGSTGALNLTPSFEPLPLLEAFFFPS